MPQRSPREVLGRAKAELSEGSQKGVPASTSGKVCQGKKWNDILIGSF